MVPRDGTGEVLDVDVRETIADNTNLLHLIRIDGFTGRPRKIERELE